MFLWVIVELMIGKVEEGLVLFGLFWLLFFRNLVKEWWIIWRVLFFNI